jgi:hypothetical protein
MIGFDTVFRSSGVPVASSSFATLGNPASLFGALVDQLQLLGLKRFNVVDAVADAAAELEEWGPLAKPPPALQSSGAEIPATGQVNLV